MSNVLAVQPYLYEHKSAYTDLRANNTNNNRSNVSFLGLPKIPPPKVKTPKKDIPVALDDIAISVARKIAENADKLGISRTDYLLQNIKSLAYIPQVIPEKSKSAVVGKTTVTTLIDGEQIFDKAADYIKSAKKSIQIEMFEFQHPQIDGNIWPANGAEVVAGFDTHKSLLPMIMKKKRENPDLKIQMILDAHKWYMDGNGNSVRHYNNQNMIKYLKTNGIDVVPYPRAAQSGAALQHVKLVAVDGKKVIMGGMNWGTHSAANHDACVSIETRPDSKHSEVDNILSEIFNKDWAFSWQRLGKTKIVAGPLTENEQQFYKGLHKEIKQENIDYMKIVGELYDNEADRTRYDPKNLEKLDLIKYNPIEKPAIKILSTKPRELAYTGEQGSESIRTYVMDKVSTSKKLKAELFVLSDKEIIQTIIDRVHKGELDAKIIVDPSIIEEFPYCNTAYQKLVENNIPIRQYKTNTNINQRMHGKWAVFDDKEVLIGSSNWSAMAMNQNLKKGQREDYNLYTEEINKEIVKYMKDVEPFEKLAGLPPLNRKKLDYKEVLSRRAKIKKAVNQINECGSANVKLQDKEYKFTVKNRSDLNTIKGYYKIIIDRNNAKEKYKRGNNEAAIAFEKPSLARVFIRQFEKDWKHSESEYEKIKDRCYETPSISKKTTAVVGSKLDLEG
ncbi:MAG: phospholipase D family protein [Candidatus Gastranaerophilales bacterium]|nr:phospholipase D family protein [Candidatus Gastranaerophilales bacterium]